MKCLASKGGMDMLREQLLPLLSYSCILVKSNNNIYCHCSVCLIVLSSYEGLMGTRDLAWRHGLRCCVNVVSQELQHLCLFQCVILPEFCNPTLLREETKFAKLIRLDAYALVTHANTYCQF